MIRLSQYRKGIGCFVGTGLLWAGPYVALGRVDRNGWYALAVKFAIDLGVVGLSNEPAPLKGGLNDLPWANLAARAAPVAAETAPAVAPVVPSTAEISAG